MIDENFIKISFPISFFKIRILKLGIINFGELWKLRFSSFKLRRIELEKLRFIRRCMVDEGSGEEKTSSG